MKVEITLKNDAEEISTSATNPPQGILPGRKKQKHLARRLRPAGIRFYDVVIKDDEQLFAAKFPEPETEESFLDIAPGVLTNDDYLDLIAQVNAFVFGVPQPEWTTRFKKLTQFDELLGDIFVKYVDDENGLIQSSIGNWLNDFEKFEDDNLKLSQTEAMTLEIRGLFSYYPDKYVKLSALPVDIKVTGEGSADADPVEFTPSRKMDIFMFPTICRVYGETEYINGLHEFIDGDDVPHTDVIEWHDFLWAGFQILQREFFPVWKSGLALDLYLQRKTQWDLWKLYPGAELKRGKYDFVETPPYDYETTYEGLSVNDFPYAPLYTATGIEEDTYLENLAIGAVVNSVSNGQDRLIWVIKQNGNYYYFWDIVS